MYEPSVTGWRMLSKTTVSKIFGWFFVLKCFGGVNAYDLSTYTMLGPFNSESECRAAAEKLTSMSSQSDCPVIVLPCWEVKNELR